VIVILILPTISIQISEILKIVTLTQCQLTSGPSQAFLHTRADKLLTRIKQAQKSSRQQHIVNDGS